MGRCNFSEGWVTLNAWIPVVSLVVGAVLLWAGDLVKQWIGRRDDRAMLKSDLDLYASLGNEFESRTELAASIDARVRGISALPVVATETAQPGQRIDRLRSYEYVGLTFYVVGGFTAAIAGGPGGGLTTAGVSAATYVMAGGFMTALLGAVVFIRNRNSRRRLEVGPPDRLVRIFESALGDDASANGDTK